MQAVLDATETAYYLRLTAETLRALVKAGQIPYRLIGKSPRFRLSELDAWLATLPGVSAEEASARMRELPPERPMRLHRARASGQ